MTPANVIRRIVGHISRATFGSTCRLLNYRAAGRAVVPSTSRSGSVRRILMAVVCCCLWDGYRTTCGPSLVGSALAPKQQTSRLPHAPSIWNLTKLQYSRIRSAFSCRGTEDVEVASLLWQMGKKGSGWGWSHAGGGTPVRPLPQQNERQQNPLRRPPAIRMKSLGQRKNHVSE